MKMAYFNAIQFKKIHHAHLILSNPTEKLPVTYQYVLDVTDMIVMRFEFICHCYGIFTGIAFCIIIGSKMPSISKRNKVAQWYYINGSGWRKHSGKEKRTLPREWIWYYPNCHHIIVDFGCTTITQVCVNVDWGILNSKSASKIHLSNEIILHYNV